MLWLRSEKVTDSFVMLFYQILESSTNSRLCVKREKCASMLLVL